jgi:hypothetical protein
LPAQLEDSDRAREIRAYTLEYIGPSEDIMLTLPLNPQQFSMVEPSRNSVQQTLAGQYVEEWGPGMRQFSIDGHTGYAVKDTYDGQTWDGYTGFQELVRLMRVYYKDARANAIGRGGAREPQQLILHIWEEDEHWQVVPTGDALRRTRSAQSPLLFSYSLSLTGVRNIRDDDLLDAGLLGFPDPFGFLDLVKGALDGLKAFALSIPGVADLVDLVGDILEAANKAVNGVTAAFNGVAAAANYVTALIKNAIRTVKRGLAKVTALVRAMGTAAAALLTLGSMISEVGCLLTNLGRSADDFLKGLGDQFLNQYNRAKRRRRRC